MPKETFWSRLVAIDPKSVDLGSFLSDFDENTEIKFGEISDFCRRLIGLDLGLSLELSALEKTSHEALNQHDEYHDSHPEEDHGGPLCENLKRLKAEIVKIDKERIKLGVMIMLAIRIDHPDLDAFCRICGDGTIAIPKPGSEAYFESHAHSYPTPSDSIN